MAGKSTEAANERLFHDGGISRFASILFTSNILEIPLEITTGFDIDGASKPSNRLVSVLIS